MLNHLNPMNRYELFYALFPIAGALLLIGMAMDNHQLTKRTSNSLWSQSWAEAHNAGLFVLAVLLLGILLELRRRR